MRRARRVGVALEVSIGQDSRYFTAQSTDLSAAGVFVVTYRVVDSGTFARLDEQLPAPVHEVDLVLVHEADLYNRNLLELQVRLATAQLLACLKPHGQLVFIRRLIGQSSKR